MNGAPTAQLSSPLDAYRWVGIVTLLFLVGGVITVISSGGNPGACGENVGCLVNTGNWGGLLHESIALALLLAILIMVILSIQGRRVRPERVLPAVLGLVLVLATAIWGAGLAAGVLNRDLAPGVLVLLTGVALSLLWGLWL